MGACGAPRIPRDAGSGPSTQGACAAADEAVGTGAGAEVFDRVAEGRAGLGDQQWLALVLDTGDERVVKR